jgi:hypothetical protein
MIFPFFSHLLNRDDECFAHAAKTLPLLGADNR